MDVTVWGMVGGQWVFGGHQSPFVICPRICLIDISVARVLNSVRARRAPISFQR